MKYQSEMLRRIGALQAGSTLQISKHQTGQVNIDSLEPSMQYVIVVWSGLNGGSMHEPFTDVLLRYGGRTSGKQNFYQLASYVQRLQEAWNLHNVHNKSVSIFVGNPSA